MRTKASTDATAALRGRVFCLEIGISIKAMAFGIPSTPSTSLESRPAMGALVLSTLGRTLLCSAQGFIKKGVVCEGQVFSDVSWIFSLRPVYTDGF